MKRVPQDYIAVTAGLLMHRETGRYIGWPSGKTIPQKEARQLHASTILQWRQKAELTQEQMGKLIGFTRNHYARLERGGAPISVQTHLAFTAALNGLTRAEAAHKVVNE